MNIIFNTLKTSLLFLVTGTAFAQSTVTFTGELTDQSCSVAVGSNDITVPFGTIPISTFDADGVKSVTKDFTMEGANKQVISSQADSLIKISRIWADFFPANTSNQPI